MYEGYRIEGRPVVLNPEGDFLDPRNDLVNHSPDGFEWGYAGSGPAQLALAILADYFDDDRMALAYYQSFKFRVVENLDSSSGWVLRNEDIAAVINNLRIEEFNKIYGLEKS